MSKPGTAENFMHNMSGDSRAAAMLLWDYLDRTDAEFMWHQWFNEAYSDQAQNGRSTVWHQIQRSLFDRLRRKLPYSFESWDCESWSFLVPFVAGGWMMSQFPKAPVSKRRGTHVHVISEEESPLD